MRVRYLGAAVAAVLALTGLAGCKTNVGQAAVIDGHKISESDISKYITPKAKPVIEQDQSSGRSVQFSPRSWVLNTLINEQLGFKLLAAIPAVSSITSTQLDAQLQNDLAGQSPTTVAEKTGLHGFTDDFYRIYLRVKELVLVVQQQPQSAVQRAFSKLKFSVSVSPRYGSWDGANLFLTPGAKLPSYLDVQPGGAVQGNS